VGSTIIRCGVAAAAGVLLASALLPINAQAASPGARVAEAANSLRASLGAEGIVEIDRDTATLRRLARLDGYLTGPSAAAPERIARDYLTERRGRRPAGRPRGHRDDRPDDGRRPARRTRSRRGRTCRGSRN